MDYTKSFAISAAGMLAERQRVDVAALNLANANTVWSPGQAGYRPLRVVSATTVIAASSSFPAQLSRQSLAHAGALLPLPVTTTTEAAGGPRRVHDPTHPLADEKGFVNYPKVDTATEMLNMVGALRAYEANVAALNTSRSLALKSLEIGGK
ncbi:MAG: flagellar basal body rod protein FlgC [Betaproteobacteria bacterium]|nr:flagellar basal body rod protein FlgC [Betaproteobacteria bacterium]